MGERHDSVEPVDSFVGQPGQRIRIGRYIEPLQGIGDFWSPGVPGASPESGIPAEGGDKCVKALLLRLVRGDAALLELKIGKKLHRRRME